MTLIRTLLEEVLDDLLESGALTSDESSLIAHIHMNMGVLDCPKNRAKIIGECLRIYLRISQ